MNAKTRPNVFASKWFLCPDCAAPHDGQGHLLGTLPDDSPGVLDTTVPCINCRCINPRETRRAMLVGATLFLAMAGVWALVLLIINL